jgi:hypothetical protein
MLKSSESSGRFSPLSTVKMMLENGIDAFKSAFLSVQPVVKIRPARQTSDKQPQRKLEAVKDFVV